MKKQKIKIRIKIYPNIGDAYIGSIFIDTSKSISIQVNEYIGKNLKYVDSWELEKNDC